MQSDEAKDDHSTCRRRVLLERLVKAGAAVWTIGVLTPPLVYLWPARRLGPGDELAIAGSIADLPVGSAKLVESGGKPIIVVRVAENDYRALSAVCTHLGCLVEWRRDKRDVFCPCHGGRFDLDGKVTGGPPPSPLPSYPVEVKNGEIQVRLKAEG